MHTCKGLLCLMVNLIIHVYRVNHMIFGQIMDAYNETIGCELA